MYTHIVIMSKIYNREWKLSYHKKMYLKNIEDKIYKIF